jgi:hypothetical protein
MYIKIMSVKSWDQLMWRNIMKSNKNKKVSILYYGNVSFTPCVKDTVSHPH